MGRVRHPTVSGSFYPSTKEELRKTINDCFMESIGQIPKISKERKGNIIAGISPHAGFFIQVL